MRENTPTLPAAPGRPRKLLTRLLVLFGALVAVPLCVAGILLSLSGRNNIQASGAAISEVGGRAFSQSANELIELATRSSVESGRHMAALGRAQVLKLGEQQGQASEHALRASGGRLIDDGAKTLEASTEQMVRSSKDVLAASNRRLRELHRKAMEDVSSLMIAEARSALRTSGDKFAELNRSSIVSLATQMSSERARRIAEQVDKYVSDVAAELATAAENPAIKSFYRFRAEPTVEDLVRLDPNVRTVRLTGPGGKSVCTVPPDLPPPVPVPLQPPPVPDGPGRFVSQATVDPVSKEALITITVPVDGAGGARGALSVTVSLSPLSQVVAEPYEAQSSGATALLAALDGTVLAHPQRDRVGTAVTGGQRAAVLASRGREFGAIETGTNDQDAELYAYARVANRPWVVVAEQPLKEMLSVTAQIRNTINQVAQDAARQMEQQARLGAERVRATAVPEQQKVADEAAEAVRAAGTQMTKDATHKLALEQQEVIAAAVHRARELAKQQAEASAATMEAQAAAAADRATLALRRQAERYAELGNARMRQSTAKAAQSASRRMLLHSAWMVAVFMAFALALAAVTASSIVRPVRRLSDCTEALARGDYSRRAPVLRNDELGRLALAFNHMALRIQAAQEELKHSNEVLAQEKSLIQAIVESSPDGLILLDERGSVVLANPAACAFLGWPQEEWQASEPTRALPPAVVAAIGAGPGPTDAVLESPQPRVVQVRRVGITNDAQHTWGQLIHLHDVTREREIDEMKSNFISLVSHELRTPLTSILGFSSYMLTGKMGPMTETQQTAVQSMYRQARRLRAIISDFLDVSRIESGRVKMRSEPVPLHEVALRALEEIRPQAEEKGISVCMAPGACRPITVMADEERVAQVFTNLLANAVKFTQPGGMVEIALESADGLAVASVRDTGIGIPESELDRIFDRFYQVERAVTRKTGGTGLGLAIVKNIVEAHGGTVMVKSAVGQGSTFSFTLPAVA